MIFNAKIEKQLGLRFYSGSQGSGNSSSATAPQMTPEQMLNLYNQYLPQTLSTIGSQVAPMTSQIAAGATGANPQYTASGLSQLQDYAPGYQAAGANLANSQAASQNALIQGAGGQAATSAANLTNTLNPALAAANSGGAAAVNAINLNGLSPGEYNATERAQNQTNTGTGNLGLSNNTNTIANAMNFGGAFNNKIPLMNSAVGAATGAGSAMTSAINPSSFATGAGNTANNFGLGTFNPTQANSTLTAPLTSASAVGGQVAQNASSSVGSAAGSNNSMAVGCYLTTACCDYMGLPDDCEELTILRQFRDTFVPPEMVKEYYRIAPSIVERIKDNKILLQFVWNSVQYCVKAIKHGHYTLALNQYTSMVNQLKG